MLNLFLETDLFPDPRNLLINCFLFYFNATTTTLQRIHISSRRRRWRWPPPPPPSLPKNHHLNNNNNTHRNWNGKSENVDALVAMGYNRQDIEDSLSQVRYDDVFATYLLLGRKSTDVSFVPQLPHTHLFLQSQYSMQLSSLFLYLCDCLYSIGRQNLSGYFIYIGIIKQCPLIPN